MKQIYPDLWVTEPERLSPQSPDLMLYAYLLVRETGNVLFCRSEHHADHRHIHDLGGITYQYLTHWHEAASGSRPETPLYYSCTTIVDRRGPYPGRRPQGRAEAGA